MVYAKNLAALLFLAVAAVCQLVEEDGADFPSSATEIPEGWVLRGCTSDDRKFRQIADRSYRDDESMTAESCVSWCAQRSYRYAGVEGGNYCYCGVQLKPLSQPLDMENCNATCSGNSGEHNCGGDLALLYYENENYGTVENPGPNGAVSKGCYLPDGPAHVLQYEAAISGGPSTMTVAKCVDACAEQKFALAAVEHSDTCLCGYETTPGTTAVDGSRCGWRCTGNVSEWCGGRRTANTYRLPIYTNETYNLAPSRVRRGSK